MKDTAREKNVVRFFLMSFIIMHFFNIIQHSKIFGRSYIQYWISTESDV